MKFNFSKAGALLLVLFSLAAQAQNIGAQLDLYTDKSDYLVGEPVVVFFSLANLGVDGLQLPLRLEPEYGAVHFEIASDRGDIFSYRGWNRTCLAESGKVSVTGDTVYGVSRLFFNGREWLFSTPGTYRITAKLFDQVCSNEIVVQVLPSDLQPQVAGQLMGNAEAGRYLLYKGGDHLTYGLETLNQILQDSLVEDGYGAHIRLAMGEAYLEDFANYVIGEVRPADPARAVAYLEQVRARPAGLYTLVEGYTLLAEGYDALNKPASASQTREDLQQIVSAEYPNYQPWVDYLIATRVERQARNHSQ